MNDKQRRKFISDQKIARSIEAAHVKKHSQPFPDQSEVTRALHLQVDQNLLRVKTVVTGAAGSAVSVTLPGASFRWVDTLPTKHGFYFYRDWNRTVKVVQILPGHRRGTLVGIVDGESIPLNEIAPGDWSSETITLP